MDIHPSIENYNSVDAAFMQMNITDKIIKDDNIVQKLDKLSLSQEIKDFYNNFRD